MFSTPIESGMLHALRQCEVMLHLTGSRYFGGFTVKSDYDFFCADTEENKRIISSLGKWTIEEMTLDSITYNDVNTSAVWIYYAAPNIHVQFVRDVERKLQVQAFLSTFPFHAVTDKKVRKYIWNWGYRLAPRD
jgi:hypothetical protein